MTEQEYQRQQRERYGKEPRSLTTEDVEDERFLEFTLDTQTRELMEKLMAEHDEQCRAGSYPCETWYIVDGSFCGWQEGRELRAHLPSLRGTDPEAGFAWNVRKPDQLFNIYMARTEVK